MSSTVIYGFKPDGVAYEYARIQNSWHGAIAVWKTIEERHLPPHRPSFVPDFIPDSEVEAFCRYKPSRVADMLYDEGLRQIWNLANDVNIPEHERICLSTTFDGVAVRKEGMQKVIDAFRAFGGTSTLPEQADVLEIMQKDPECIAVAWDQNDMSCGRWSCDTYDDENDEAIPYNILLGKSHWFLDTEMGW